MDLEFVERNEREDVKKIDKDVKNKFNWAWLQESDVNNEFLSDYIRKLKEPGMAWCITCRSKIIYGSSGKKALISHSKNVQHGKMRRALKCAQSLPTVMAATRSVEDCSIKKTTLQSEQLPYGTAINVQNFFQNNKLPEVQPVVPTPVSFMDRKSHLEGTILAFVAEHDLPLSSVPNIISLAKELSRDPKALNELAMERTSATYKLVHGFHTVVKKRVLNSMRENKFSLNIDESTTKASKKRVMNIIVCYYSEELMESVTELYCSIEMAVVNAETVYQAVRQQLLIDGVPFDNLIALLTDSAAYMRGCVNGFQQKMKQDAPHLIDIDGDVCHHIHNIVKCFNKELDPEGFLTRFLDDVFKDFSFSADLKEDLGKISESLSLPVLSPLERVPHRWLSVYDTTIRMLELMDQLTIFYFAWLSKEDKELYKSETTTRLKNTDSTQREVIFTVLKRLKGKNLTPAGLERKKRIATKLFHKRRHLLILSQLTVSIMPMFKSFVLLFEQKVPMVHRLHDALVDTLKNFFASFVNMDFIKTKKLLTMDLGNKDIHLPLSQIYTGSKAADLVKTMDSVDKHNIRLHLQTAYVKTGEYMQKKLPVNNTFLKSLSALDPITRGHSVAVTAMKSLPQYFPTIDTDKEAFEKELTSFHLADDLPPCDNIRLDHWWAQVIPKYPTLSIIVKACLAIFTGPRVEQSFSMMNHIITSKTNRMAIRTYAAYQAIKYHLLARKQTSLQMFRRQDVIYSSVDRSLVYHLQTAKQIVYSIYIAHIYDQVVLYAESCSGSQRSLKTTPSSHSTTTTASSRKSTPLSHHDRSRQQVEEILDNTRARARDSLLGAPAPKRQK